MTRYFFHVRNKDELVEDPDGVDLPDIDAARREAIAAARELIREAAMEGKLPLSHQFEVGDSEGKTVLVVPFNEAVQVS